MERRYPYRHFVCKFNDKDRAGDGCQAWIYLEISNSAKLRDAFAEGRHDTEKYSIGKRTEIVHWDEPNITSIAPSMYVPLGGR